MKRFRGARHYPYKSLGVSHIEMAQLNQAPKRLWDMALQSDVFRGLLTFRKPRGYSWSISARTERMASGRCHIRGGLRVADFPDKVD